MYSNLTQRAKRITSVVNGAYMTIWNDSIRTVVLTFIFEVDSYLSAIMEEVNKKGYYINKTSLAHLQIHGMVGKGLYRTVVKG